MITISQPYIKKQDDGTVALCSMVNYDGAEKEVWYSVEEKYGEYLCFERADAFVLAFLPFAMAFQKDIKVQGKLSERLFFQLKNYYIPSLKKFSNYYKSITITCQELDRTNFCASAEGVGTGFSAGVDSFYTVMKHLNDTAKSFSLTHLAFFKVGATGSADVDIQRSEEAFQYRISQFRPFVEKNHLEFLIVNSNVADHAKMSYNYIHTFRSMSAVLALQKLFKVYYYSSATTIADFAFNVVDAANFDFFNLKNFEVEGMQLYSDGLDCERLEKQQFIQDFPETYEYLNVCNVAAKNCSKCEKCIRTMTGFHCLGVLDRYAKVFDVEYYKSHFAKCMGLLLGKRYDGTAEGNIDAILVKNMKKAGIRLPVMAYVCAVPVALKAVAFRVARSIKPIRRWYHKRMSKKLGFHYMDD